MSIEIKVVNTQQQIKMVLKYVEAEVSGTATQVGQPDELR